MGLDDQMKSTTRLGYRKVPVDRSGAKQRYCVTETGASGMMIQAMT